MENVTYIIPLHQSSKKVLTLLKRALDSLKDMTFNEGDKVMLVGKKKDTEKAKEICDSVGLKQDVVVVDNDNTGFFEQVNKAALNCVTPYFSILEFDDAYKPYWNDVAHKYMKDGVSLIIPINEFYDGKDESTIGEKMLSFGNEIAWSSVFIDEDAGIGYLTMNNLKTYSEFNLTGAFIKTEDFISIGGLKPSLKVAAWFEFLLRMAYNSKKMFVAPKIGYEHTIMRDGSYMANARTDVSREEGSWLFEKAKQEYFFKEDRNLEFKPEN